MRINPILFLIFYLAGAFNPALGEVIPIRQFEKTGQVTPYSKEKKEKEIVPLTEKLLSEEKVAQKVLATGSAEIIHGDTERARREALLNAYRFAVNTGVGVEIGELFVMKNFEEFTDVIVKQSRGYIKSYKILSEGVDEDEPGQYSVVIEAEVREGNMWQDKDYIALKLYLEVIDNPKILILLSDIGGSSSQSISEAIAPGPAEIELAKVFHDSGYVVLTADDIMIGDLSGKSVEDWLKHRSPGKVSSGQKAISEEELLQARKGYTAMAREVGRKAGADIIICGTIKITAESLYGAGPNKVQAASYVKAVVCSTGQAIVIDTYKVTDRAETYESARAGSIEKVAKSVGEDLIWRIPEVLAKNEKILTLKIKNATLRQVSSLREAIKKLPGVESVIMGTWEREPDMESRGTIDFEIHAGFLGISSEKLYQRLKEKSGLTLMPRSINKYSLELVVGN